MTTSTTPAEVAAYVEACELYLRDLDLSTQEQLRLDIVEIVSEVCGELDGTPDDLVGTPRRFVSELRVAAGLPLPEPEPAAATAGIASTVRRVAAHRSIGWLRDLAPELRPAWWVARGVLLGWVAAWITGADGPSWILNTIPHWPVAGSSVLGLGVVAGAVYLSVEAGRRRLRGWQRVVGTVASVVAVVFAASIASQASRWTEGPATYPSVASPMSSSAFVSSGGPAFSPVVIGSHLTSERIEVIDLLTAGDTVARLLADAPPASIYLEFDGGQHQPGTRAEIGGMLDDLVDRGLLKGD